MSEDLTHEAYVDFSRIFCMQCFKLLYSVGLMSGWNVGPLEPFSFSFGAGETGMKLVSISLSCKGMVQKTFFG